MRMRAILVAVAMLAACGEPEIEPEPEASTPGVADAGSSDPCGGDGGSTAGCAYRATLDGG